MADIEARIRVKDDMSPALNGIVKKINTVLSKIDAVVTGSGKVTRGFQSASSAATNLERSVSLAGVSVTKIGEKLDKINKVERERLAIGEALANTGKLDAEQKQKIHNLLQERNRLTRLVGQHEADNMNRSAQIYEIGKKIESLNRAEVLDYKQITKLTQQKTSLERENERIQGIINKHKQAIIQKDLRIKNIGDTDVATAKVRESLLLQYNSLATTKLRLEEEYLNVLQKAVTVEDNAAKKAIEASERKLQTERKQLEAADKRRWAEWDANQAHMRKMIVAAEEAERKKEQIKIKAAEAEDRRRKKEFDSAQASMRKMIIASEKQAEREAQAAERASQRKINTWRKETAEKQRLESKAAQYSSALWDKVKMVGGMYLGTQGVGSVINTADQLASNDARLALMVKEGETVDQLSNKIYEAAMRSRVGYMYMADSVAKVGIQAGNLFDNNDQMVRFMETFGKMAVISKSTTQQTNAAMTQMIQALSFGQLRGDELKSILENMPMVAQVLADELTRMGDGYFKTLPDKLKHIAADSKITAEEIRELGYEGKISAETVVNAMLNGSKKVDDMAKNMTWTWAQVWTVFKNHALKAFTPVLNGISKIIQTERFQRFATWLGNLVARIAKIMEQLWKPVGEVLAWIFDIVAGIGNFISNNWSYIAPIVLGIAAAFAVLKTKAVAVWLWTKLVTIATKAWTAVQSIFNAVMAANPVALVCLAIIALIALIYIVVAAINDWLDTSISATGVIIGSLYWLWEVICNIAKGVANIVIGVCEWCVNAWDWCCNNIGIIFDNIGIWWDNLWADCKIGLNNFLIWAVNKLAGLADKIKPLTDALGIDLSGLTGRLNDKNNALESSKKSYKSLVPMGKTNWETFAYGDLSDAYDKGYAIGEKIENKLSKFGQTEKTKDPTKQYENDLIKALQNGYNDPNAVSNPALDKIGGNTDKIADNTGSAADSLESNAEDTKYLRELAHREAINKYTLTDLNVNMTNNNNIASDVDVDNVAYKIYGALANLAGGTHGKRYAVR